MSQLPWFPMAGVSAGQLNAWRQQGGRDNLRSDDRQFLALMASPLQIPPMLSRRPVLGVGGAGAVLRGRRKLPPRPADLPRPRREFVGGAEPGGNGGTQWRWSGGGQLLPVQSPQCLVPLAPLWPMPVLVGGRHCRGGKASGKPSSASLLEASRRWGFRSMQFNLGVSTNHRGIPLLEAHGFRNHRHPAWGFFAHRQLGYVDAYVNGPEASWRRHCMKSCR